MKTLSLPFAAWALTVLLPSQVDLPSNIDDQTFGPLRSGTTYVARSLVRVPSGRRLTIEPGAIIKFAARTQLFVFGNVQADGTSSRPIVLTSIHDDSVGVALGTRAPAAGDWSQLQLRSPSISSLQHVEIRFGGFDVRAVASLQIQAPAIVRSTTIRDGAGPGVLVSSVTPTLDRCSIARNAGIAIDGVVLAGLDRFTNNTATGNAGGDSLRIADGTVTQPVAIGPTNLLGRVLLVPNSISVQGAAARLTLAASTIVKLGRSASIQISQGASFEALGDSSRPVVLTSDQDDSIGGDSLGDGATQGQPGDWRFVRTINGNARIRHARIRFGGALANFGTLALGRTSDTRIVDSVIEQSASDAIQFSAADLDPGQVAVERCAIQDNRGRALTPVLWHTAMGLRDNTAQRNGSLDFVEINTTNTGRPATTVAGNVVLEIENTLNGNGLVICQGAMLTNTTQRLQLGAGLRLKLGTQTMFACRSAGTLVFDGRPQRPLTVTSVLDDSVGGDTNGDGNATRPAPGNWRFIDYQNGAMGSMDYVTVRYGGGETRIPGAVRCNTAATRITSVRSEFSQTSGFFVRNVKDPAANWVAFRNNGVGINLRGGSFAVQHATVTENANVGIFSDGSYTGTVFSSVSWNNAQRTGSDNFVNVRVTRCNGSRSNGNFFADPQFIDVQNGDLHVSPFSIQVGRADLGQATLWGVDFDGNSRILDHALNGLALPDIGAYEVFQYRTRIVGEPRIDSTLRFIVEGPGPARGPQVVFVGGGLTGQFVPPLGVLLTGTLNTSVVLAVQPAKSTFVLPIPNASSLVGERFGLQIAVLPRLDIIAGNLCNAFLATVRR